MCRVCVRCRVRRPRRRWFRCTTCCSVIVIPVAEPGTATGTPGDWWPVFALVPDVFDHSVRGFALYQSPKRLLDPQLRELGQTRVGFTCASQFVFSQHCKSCRTAGMAEEKIAAIPHWQVAECFSPLERAVLAYADALT